MSIFNSVPSPPSLNQLGMVGSVSGSAAYQQYQNQQYQNQLNQASAQMAHAQNQTAGPSHNAIRQHVHGATLGWMAKDAACIFTDAELAEKIWDMAEALAKEGTKRGYY